MHDAAEAYLCDVPRPVKSRLPGFDAMELRLLQSIAAWLGLPDPDPLPAHVRLIDDHMLAAEWDVLMPESVLVKIPDVPESSPVRDVVVVPWSLEKGKIEFMSMFDRLFGG